MLKKITLRNTVTAFTLAGLICIGSAPIYAELGDQVLKKGMSHDDIMTLQQNLADLGYFDYDELTTYFGVETENAVIDFQKSTDLEASGIFDEVTYKALTNIINLEEESQEKVDTPLEEENKEDEEKYKLVLDRSLKMGLSGLDVKSLQEVLKGLGFLKIDECTDYFGTQTKEALIAFQENNGLEADGVAGPKTTEALNRQLIRKGLKISMPNRSNFSRQELGDKLISTAKQYIGVRYRYGGTTTNGFDCAGYTQFVFKKLGIDIPRSTLDQAVIGTKLSKSELKIGDLVIFSGTYRKGPSHVGIYISDGNFIHASTSRGVIIDNLDSAYYAKHFSYGRRLK